MLWNGAARPAAFLPRIQDEVQIPARTLKFLVALCPPAQTPA
jgi:hypothetical protein